MVGWEPMSRDGFAFVVLQDVGGAIPYRVGELSGCRGFSVVCSLIELNNIVDDI